MDGKLPLSKITLNKRTNSGTKPSLNVIKYLLSKLSLPADFFILNLLLQPELLSQ